MKRLLANQLRPAVSHMKAEPGALPPQCRIIGDLTEPPGRHSLSGWIHQSHLVISDHGFDRTFAVHEIREQTGDDRQGQALIENLLEDL